MVRVLLLWGGLGLLGSCYAWIMTALGYGIPCMFHLLTGLQCPGCGISRMALCLLRGDLAGAFSANAGILCLLPLALLLALDQSFRYILSGKKTLGQLENGLVTLILVFLILFGILRNLPE